MRRTLDEKYKDPQQRKNALKNNPQSKSKSRIPGLPKDSGQTVEELEKEIEGLRNNNNNQQDDEGINIDPTDGWNIADLEHYSKQSLIAIIKWQEVNKYHRIITEDDRTIYQELNDLKQKYKICDMEGCDRKGVDYTGGDLHCKKHLKEIDKIVKGTK